MEERFTGAWAVLGSATPSAKAVTQPEMSLAVLSFGVLPPIQVTMKGSNVQVGSGEYRLIHACAPKTALERGQEGAASAGFVAALSGLVDFDTSPALGVTFKQFTVAPMLGEGGKPVPESAAAVADIAKQAAIELDAEGRIVAALAPQIASNKTTITVVHNDGEVHAHEGFMKYVMQKVEAAPSCALPKL